MTTAAIYPTWGVLRGASYYRAEQYDSDLGLYYMRARYYNPLTGRFMSRDPEDGKAVDPKTLHKYLYAGGDPVNGVDPMGREEEIEDASVTAYREAKVIKTAFLFAVDTACYTATFSAAIDWFLDQPTYTLGLSNLDYSNLVVGCLIRGAFALLS
jgi:RHS repeat-associated protein